MLRAFGHPVAMCCDVLGVVGSNLTIFKPEPTTPNMSQHGGQTHATCCAQQCCDMSDMLRWHVAIVWPGLNILRGQKVYLRSKTTTKNTNCAVSVYHEILYFCKNAQTPLTCNILVTINCKGSHTINAANVGSTRDLISQNKKCV